MGYSPRGCKESDMTERLSTHSCMHIFYRQLIERFKYIINWEVKHIFSSMYLVPFKKIM